MVIIARELLVGFVWMVRIGVELHNVDRPIPHNHWLTGLCPHEPKLSNF